MKLFLDTIDVNEIIEFQSYHMIDGITTNPSLFVNTERKFIKLAQELCSVVQGDISLEVISKDYDGMIDEGNRICDLADNVVVKIPMTLDGIKACQYFAKKNIKVNMTLCFSAIQALLAARVGATYISPFIGRLDDIGDDGLSLISDIRQIYNNYSLNTHILAASVRSIRHVTEVAKIGVDYITMPAKLMRKLIEHPLTTQGLNQFYTDWQQSGHKI